MENRTLPVRNLADFIGYPVERLPLPAMVVIVTALGRVARPGRVWNAHP